MCPPGKKKRERNLQNPYRDFLKNRPGPLIGKKKNQKNKMWTE